ncbi:MAG: hypothetical protein DI555_06885 [Novosphingobium pentaromativorans]|uniref:LexA repressor DNA-binding domain-containing protein n=1 Tax=Novosphingobium pentaromativorans TaxID=205844 RepID=A0A2W5NZ01_9SPHN|nr:MAG: hypothetical protein DI555_06885 [Novosphingobium pentaromativorans]
MIGLTTQQSNLLAYLRRYLDSSGGVAPCFSEMMAATGAASKSGIHRLLTALEERGHIRRIPDRARAIELVDHSDLSAVPVHALLAELRRRDIRLVEANPEVVAAITPHAPQAPAREGVTLPVRSFEPHTPLRDRTGLSAHNQSHAAEVR